VDRWFWGAQAQEWGCHLVKIGLVTSVHKSLAFSEKEEFNDGERKFILYSL